MKTLRRLWRFIRVVMHLVWGIILQVFFIGSDPESRTPKDWAYMNGWARGLAKVLGLRINCIGEPIPGPALFLANHISWHDIIVMMSLAPAGFIAKSEIRNWPIVGWMAYRGSTLFIRRGQRDSSKLLQDHIQQRLAAGQNVLLFPESTTSDGKTVLPFRTRMFQPAIDLGLPVQPVTIYYHSPDKNMAELAFIHHESLLSHGWRMLGERYIDVTVQFCAPLKTTKSKDRRELGRLTHTVVLHTLESIESANLQRSRLPTV